MSVKSEQTVVRECISDAEPAFLNGLTNGFDAETTENMQNRISVI